MSARVSSIDGGSPIESSNLDHNIVDRYLSLVAKTSNVGGIGVSLRIRGDSNTWMTSAPSREPVRFQIGCVTKSLVAATVLELEALGALDIALPIAQYLTEFDGTPAGERVQVQHLLSDTSGYLGFPALDNVTEMTWQGLVTSLTECPLMFEPGTVYSLDQSNQVLLAEIIKRVAGRSWTDLVDEEIGQPVLGRSLFSEQDRHKLWAASAASTALSSDELALMGEVLMTGVTTSGRILKECTVSRLQKEVVLLPKLASELRVHSHWLPVGHGLGLPLYHSGLRGETGKGRDTGGAPQRCSMHFSQPMGMILAVCVDGGGASVRNGVVDGILAELGVRAPEKVVRVPLAVALEELSGDYIGLRGTKVRVEVEGQRLYVNMKDDSRLLRCVCIIHDDGTLSIDEGENGPVVAGLGFFIDSKGVPSLMIGVHALRKAESHCN